MRLIHAALPALLLTAGLSGALIAQPAMQPPGQPDVTRVTAGTYNIDPHHTQILFSYSHFGFSHNMGLLSGATGTLTLDPKHPAAAKLSVDVPINTLHTTIAALDSEFQSASWFDPAKYPMAHFVSTKVTPGPDGKSAAVAGNLTIKGITKPVVLNVTFVAAGIDGFSKKEAVGFQASGTIKRSDFGLGEAVPLVSDQVKLKIVAALEKAK